MALVQDADIVQAGPTITGQTLQARLVFAGGKVELQLSSQSISYITSINADVGSAAATTLLTYFNQSTGELTSTGETWAKAQPYNGNTVDTYFS